MKLPFRGKRQEIAFNMTPMIDVVFQLLIFFLVSSQLVRHEARMELPLPVASSGEPMKPNDQALIVNVDRRGVIWLAGKPLAAPELARRLGEQAKLQKEPLAVRVRGDRDTEYRFVQPVLAACANAGVWRVDVSVVAREEAR